MIFINGSGTFSGLIDLGYVMLMAARRLLLLLLLLLICSHTLAATVHVAVASNFKQSLQQLAPLFQKESGHKLLISSASTGKLYAQIRHGAPFELFLAADAARPKQLVHDGLAIAGSRQTYAIGQLALWSHTASRSGTNLMELLKSGQFDRLSIANPKTAPYGLAAKQTLEALGLWDRLQGKIVRGENIGQAFQFVASGAATIGLISLAQIRLIDKQQTHFWLVPDKLYAPIQQQLVLLNRGAANPATQALIDFLSSDRAKQQIKESGYRVQMP